MISKYRIVSILKSLLFFIFLNIPSQASFVDNYHLSLAYKSYVADDFNATQKHLKKIKQRSLQSQMTLANTYYKQRSFKKAIQIYQSIRSTSTEIKQQLYYNIANAYAQTQAYDKAKIYYIKTLQLGEDGDAIHNLKLIVLLADKKSAQLGIAHPKSQSSSASKSDVQEDKEETRSEDKPSAGSGGAGESSAKEKLEKNKLLSDQSQEKHPLSSKVYELINKGYIHEKQPW